MRSRDPGVRARKGGEPYHRAPADNRRSASNNTEHHLEVCAVSGNEWRKERKKSGSKSVVGFSATPTPTPPLHTPFFSWQCAHTPACQRAGHAVPAAAGLVRLIGSTRLKHLDASPRLHHNATKRTRLVALSHKRLRLTTHVGATARKGGLNQSTIYGWTDKLRELAQPRHQVHLPGRRLRRAGASQLGGGCAPARAQRTAPGTVDRWGPMGAECGVCFAPLGRRQPLYRASESVGQWGNSGSLGC